MQWGSRVDEDGAIRPEAVLAVLAVLAAPMLSCRRSVPRPAVHPLSSNVPACLLFGHQQPQRLMAVLHASMAMQRPSGRGRGEEG